jgi:hypothetical protein
VRQTVQIIEKFSCSQCVGRSKNLNLNGHRIRETTASSREEAALVYL